MVEEDKRVMATRLKEMISDVKKLTNTQMDMVNKLMIANQILNHKDVDVANLKSHNEILKNELKNEKESMDKFNKPKDAMKYYEELINSSSCSNGSGHLYTMK